MTKKSITINPARDFIMPPFITCPFCNAEESFGILMVLNDNFIRRCKSCMKEEAIELPVVNKKVIYIDQFMLSEMVKANNNSKKDPTSKYWRKVYKKLRTLILMQQIVCPYSEFHTNESLMTPLFEKIRELYRNLSSNSSFKNSDEIINKQMYEHASRWIKGDTPYTPSIEIKDAIRDDIHTWDSNVQININTNYGLDWIENLRSIKDMISDEIQVEVVSRWKKEKNKEYDYWVADECIGFGNVILTSKIRYLDRIIQEGITLDTIMLSDNYQRFEMLKNLFIKQGIDEKIVESKVAEYLRSPDLINIPYVKLNSSLWAALAYQYARVGRIKELSNGMSNDISFIATFLPYCDAMFIDREMFTLLTQNPLAKNIQYDTKLFSMANKTQFLDYLQKIEDSIPEDVKEKAKELYG